MILITMTMIIMIIMMIKMIMITSCGGTSNETVLKSTFLYASIHGITKKMP